MQAKVDRHKVQRGGAWTTIEEPLDVAGVLGNVSGNSVVLVDCATLWLSNVLMKEADADKMIPEFVAACLTCPVPVVVVSNELGMGIVPENALGRRFRNLHGRMNQDFAQMADTVVFVAAGLPMMLKGAL